MGMSIDEWELVFDENSAASELERFLEILQKQEAKDDIGKAINRKHQSVIKVAIQACKFRAEYENRLKADLKAILVELQLEIEELNHKGSNCYRDGYTPYSEGLDDCKDIIQQKINSLKEA